VRCLEDGGLKIKIWKKKVYNRDDWAFFYEGIEGSYSTVEQRSNCGR
jgi:hypothetical protein